MFILRYNENDITKPLNTSKCNKYWLYGIYGISKMIERNIYDLLIIIESSQFKWFIF